MTKKLYIRTFGCQMNEYDSDKMADVLAASDGLTLTDRPEDADVILFNTCSVREKAQEKVFSDLGRVRQLKRDNPDLVIGVGGCVASQEGAAIVARAPYVDVVFGPQTLHRLPALIARRRTSGRPQVDVSFPEIEKFDHLPPPRVEGPTAFVSIMEGCSKYCSFCVVPYTRGEEISRPFDDVLTEVADLADHGVREVTLLGQNVNAYRAASSDGEPADLALLIEYIAEIPGIERIRYTTSHPKEFTQRLIDVYARVPQLVGHVHLPVQAGSDRVLSAMKRGYTVLEYKSIVRRLRRVRPDISLSSDFIIASPAKPKRTSPRRCGWSTNSASTRVFRSSTAVGPVRRRPIWPTTPRSRSQAGAPGAVAVGDQRQRRAHFRRDGRQRAAGAGRGPVKERCRRIDGPDREQPDRQFRRRPAPRAADRPHARGTNYTRVSALAAGRCGTR
jgi:tRNA-2-methylthio-N6-dimethylallyladenosine synthase